MFLIISVGASSHSITKKAHKNNLDHCKNKGQAEMT